MLGTFSSTAQSCARCSKSMRNMLHSCNMTFDTMQLPAVGTEPASGASSHLAIAQAGHAASVCRAAGKMLWCLPI